MGLGTHWACGFMWRKGIYGFIVFFFPVRKMFIFTEWHASRFVPSLWDGVLGMAVLGAGHRVKVGEFVFLRRAGEEPPGRLLAIMQTF